MYWYNHLLIHAPYAYKEYPSKSEKIWKLAWGKQQENYSGTKNPTGKSGKTSPNIKNNYFGKKKLFSYPSLFGEDET